MFSLNTGVLEADDVLFEQHTSEATYDLMPKLNHIHLATSPHSLSAVAGQLCHLFVRLLEQGPSIFVCAVDRSVRTRIVSGERQLPSHVCFVVVVLVWHVVLLGPGCVRVSEQHQCVAHHVQDRREMLPIFLQRAVCARTMSAEIWVGSDKLLGGYRQKSCNLVVTAGASDSLLTLSRTVTILYRYLSGIYHFLINFSSGMGEWYMKVVFESFDSFQLAEFDFSFCVA